MATVQKRRNSDGTTSFLAWVRIGKFKPATQAFPTRKEALVWAAALERELRKRRDEADPVSRDVTRLTVADLARQFLADTNTKALRTYNDLERLVLWWVNKYGSERILQFNVLTLREARAKLEPGRAPATVNRYLSAMRSCWNWGRSAGLVPQDRLWPDRLALTEPRERTRHLSDDELQRLLTEARAAGPTMYAAVVVSLATGVRQGELLRLRWSDVDLENKRIRVLLTKNGESRAVHLPPVAVEALRALTKGTIVGQHVISNEAGQAYTKSLLESRWKKLRSEAKLTDFRWHDLRHSCASFLAQKGASLIEIGSVLGHKSPSVTRRYAHLVEGAPVTGHAGLDDKLRGNS